MDEKLDLVLELETDVLPLSKKHVGPPVWISSSSNFLDKWKGGGLSDPYIENGHWTVMVRREHPTAKGLIESKGTTAAMGSDLRTLKGLVIHSGRGSTGTIRGHC